MKSKHTLPTVVTNQWSQDPAAHDASTRRATGNLDSWSVNAEFWDRIVGEGNDMYQELVLPAIEEMASVQPGNLVLDLATGNGIAARMLQRNLTAVGGGGKVIASDGCPELLQHAQKRERQGIQHEGQEVGKIEGGMEYVQLDLMDESKLMAFARENAGQFDVITLVMAILELPSLEPLCKALPLLLKPRTGRFIAVNLHPAFSKPGAHRVMEVLENPNTGVQETRHWIKASGYLSIPPCSSQGIRDQPAPQTLFHRPLQDVMLPFFQNGLALDGFKELAFKHEPDRAQIQSYHNFPQFPMLVALRMRTLA